jgi:hypothetical protein
LPELEYERITRDDVEPEVEDREGKPSKREEDNSFRGGLEKDRLAKLPRLEEERITGDEFRSEDEDRVGYSFIVSRLIPPVTFLSDPSADRSPI